MWPFSSFSNCFWSFSDRSAAFGARFPGKSSCSGQADTRRGRRWGESAFVNCFVQRKHSGRAGHASRPPQRRPKAATASSCKLPPLCLLYGQWVVERKKTTCFKIFVQWGSKMRVSKEIRISSHIGSFLSCEGMCLPDFQTMPRHCGDSDQPMQLRASSTS